MHGWASQPGYRVAVALTQRHLRNRLKKKLKKEGLGREKNEQKYGFHTWFCCQLFLVPSKRRITVRLVGKLLWMAARRRRHGGQQFTHELGELVENFLAGLFGGLGHAAHDCRTDDQAVGHRR